MASGDKPPVEIPSGSSEPLKEEESVFSKLKGYFNKAPEGNELFAPIFPVSQGPYSPISNEEVDAFIANETGWDRIKHMFSYNPLTKFSADLYNVFSVAAPVTIFSGMIIGALRYPRAKEDFMRSPERGLVKFQRKNLRMAKRYKYDIITLDVMKTAGRAAFKFGGFFTCILLVNQTLATYNNKSSPLYYGAGGAAAGALNKFSYGVRAMVSGGTVAGIMGLLYGGAFCVFLNHFGMTQDKLHWEDVKKRLEVGFEQSQKKYENKTDSNIKSKGS
ncbi:complex I assembly factor TIMMDC1, mitochondrial-like [Saccostrea echinata]|uniref:complex I assembly factor TIMMDC1, mitochondrial-like n=1 Tax=Saccostrea echinata TaxID=191078 RepID=UPI002A83C930|nr:complex I assembly factor TIMMDC1, mitochondrial-like [Saccostrea echinata]